MKKLLALILCVMLFVSVIPTSAFADGTWEVNLPWYKANSGWASLKSSKDAVSNAKKNLEYMYGALAADTAVFGTVKSIDGIVTELAKGLFDGIDDYTLYNVKKGDKYYNVTLSGSTLEDNTKAYLRATIGTEISKYMDEHFNKFASGHVLTRGGYSAYTDGTWAKKNADGKFVDPDGNVISAEDMAKKFAVIEYSYDPVKYIDTFAKAASEAFNSKESAKAIEALVANLAVAKTLQDMDEKYDDLWDEMKEWEDGSKIFNAYGWNEGFYPYAMLDGFDLPKNVSVPNAIVAPDATSVWVYSHS